MERKRDPVGPPPVRSARQDVLCCGTHCPVIKSFADKRLAAIFAGLCPRGTLADVANAARRKLAMIDKALDLEDLRSPPGNRREAVSLYNAVSRYNQAIEERYQAIQERMTR
jgi:plasmid maintenance system killer protein